jgi:hypothetical protein
VPKNQEEYCWNSARKGNDEYHLLNAKSTLPKLLATTVREFSTKSSRNAAISAITTILATFSAVLPSVAGSSVNSALLLALRKMKALGHQTFIIKTDSIVIQEHIEKESKARNPVLMKYLEKVKEMERHFKGYSVQHIPRDNNNEADKLYKAATRNQEMPPDVFFEIIKESSIKETKPKIVNFVETPDWRTEIMAYLRGHYKPQDELEDKRLKQRARGYAVVNGELTSQESQNHG